MTSQWRVYSALILTLGAAATLTADPLYRPPGLRSSPPLDLTWRQTIHNSFWHGDPSDDTSASGPKQHLLDDLYIDRARGLEFDLHADADAHEFRVYHTRVQGYSLCRKLTSCLDVVRAFHYGDPAHDPLFIHLEAKETSGGRFFTPTGLTPQDLDAVVTSKLSDKNGQWVYSPGEYFSWCENVRWNIAYPDPAHRPVFRTLVGDNLRQAVRYCGWPTLDELRGRIILTIHGTWNANEVDVDDYSHAYNRTIRQVQAFPMASLIGRGAVIDCGFSGVCNWADDSVIEDVGTLDPAQYPGPPFNGDPALHAVSLRLDHGLARTDGTTTVEMDAATHSFRNNTFSVGQPIPAFNMINTDAPRNNPLNYPALPYAAGPFAAGCIYYPNSNTFFPGCELRNLPEPAAAIEVHAWGNRAGLDAGNTADQLIFLARERLTGQAGDFRAFISTRTESLQGAGTEANLGFTMIGRWGCVMARETLDPSSAFFAVCRYRHRLSWGNDKDGIYALVRPSSGAPTQAYYYDTDPPGKNFNSVDDHEDGSGPPELDGFVQITHDASGRCFTGSKRVTDDPLWKQQVNMFNTCFTQPLKYIGVATDGGSDDRGNTPVRGDYLFANIRYNNKFESTAGLAYQNIGMPRDAEVIDRTFIQGLCAPEITELVEVIPGGFSRYGFTTVYYQQVTLRNTSGQAIQGPVNLQFAGLTDGVTVYNSGTSTCKDPISSYVTVPMPAGGTWAPGQTISVTVAFQSPANKQIRYSPLVTMAGGRL